MVQAQENKRLSVFASILFLLFFGGNLSAQQDPPSRVARLNYVNGNVSMEPAGVDEWAPAEINRPFTIGDYLYADQGAAAELHLDVAVLRIGSQTSFGFLNLDDRTVQLKLTEGDMYIRVHNFGSDQVFEVDTPNAAVNLLRDGTYRFRVDSNGSMSFLVVRQGEAQVTGGGQAFTLNADNSATLTGTDQLAYDIEVAPQPDQFDQWSEQRDAHEARLASAQYLPPTVIGYEDLDDHGTWQENDQYGAVWYPRSVDSRVGSLSVRTLGLDRSLGLDVGGQHAMGFCSVSLWAVGIHQQPLGMVSRSSRARIRSRRSPVLCTCLGGMAWRRSLGSEHFRWRRRQPSVGFR